MLRHIPVLAQEIYDNLPENWIYGFDGTFGHGGHAEFFLEHEKEKRAIDGIKIVGTDVDALMIKKARELTSAYEKNIEIHQGSYASVLDFADEGFDYMLLDLGVNLEHFKDGSRGFSIKTDAPLDMRFNQSSGVTAEEWLMKTKPIEIQNALIKYGDFSEKTAEYLTKLFCERREKSPFKTTFQLKDFLMEHHFNQKKVAVIFQVIRIMVNQELEQLEQFLSSFPKGLKKAGRCFIITYHSVEDRITKNAFKALAETGEFVLVNKKVIVPHYTEVQRNKAARSAKLRIIEKL